MKYIIVMGMHSSATSLVAEGLARAGVQMWLKTRNSHYEDAEMKRINDEILAAAGGDWRNPPSISNVENIIYNEELATKAEKAIEQRMGADLWGFKDPRTAITWPLWEQILPTNGRHVIFVDRNTDETAASCRSRWGRHKDWRGLVVEYKRRMTQIKEEAEQ